MHSTDSVIIFRFCGGVLIALTQSLRGRKRYSDTADLKTLRLCGGMEEGMRQSMVPEADDPRLCGRWRAIESMIACRIRFR